MDLSPYLDSLQRDLAAAGATGSEDVRRAAELLGGALTATARLCLMEALADAADEVTSKLDDASVEVRLRGRDADLVVTPIPTVAPEPAPGAAAGPGPGPESPAPGGPELSAEVARITLRLPESLKESVERAAAGEGISVNAWLVRAIHAAVTGGPGSPPPPPNPPFPPGRARFGRRVTGYAQA